MAITVEEAQKWVLQNYDKLDADRQACEDEGVQFLNRFMPAKSKLLWGSGCWLAQELRLLGASEETIVSLQFAAGQRALAGDAWQACVDYVNEFAATGETVEKGGAELAVKINHEMFGR